MSAVPIVILGTMTDAAGNTKQVTISGIAAQSGLEVGGGPPPAPTHPIVLPEPPDSGVPSHPIVLPPSPAHPIVLPPTEPPPTNPPEVPGGPMLPPGWSWYYTDRWGWILIYYPAGGGKPRPPGSPEQPEPTPYPARPWQGR